MIYALFLSGYYQNYYRKYSFKPPTNTLTMNSSKLIHGALIVALSGILNMNLASAADLPPASRTKVMAVSPQILENCGYEDHTIYR